MPKTPYAVSSGAPPPAVMESSAIGEEPERSVLFFDLVYKLYCSGRSLPGSRPSLLAAPSPPACHCEPLQVVLEVMVCVVLLCQELLCLKTSQLDEVYLLVITLAAKLM